MNGTYYNLPAISCLDRIKTWDNLKGAEAATMCSNLNPDKIYNSLYPCSSDVLKGFIKNQGQQSSGKIIKTLRNQTPTSCAKACLSTTGCAQFNINNTQPTCKLYHTKSYKYNSSEAQKESINNSLSVFQYDRTVKANCGQNCKEDKLKNFTEASQYTVPNEWPHGTALSTSNAQTLDDCKQDCINNSSCNSIVFEQPFNNCDLLNEGGVLKTKGNIDNYTINQKSCQNIFGFSQKAFDNPNYRNAYNSYQTSGDDYGGKVGDYFCKYMSGANTCVEYKDVTCNTNRRRKKKPPKPNPHAGPSACIPPLCDPNSGKPIHKTIKGIQINDYQFNSCQKGKDKGFCLEDIYTFDDLGLPVTQSASNPPGKNFLYTKDFSIQNGFRIYSCMKGLNPYKKDKPTQEITNHSQYTGDYICSDGKETTCLPYGQENTDGQYVTCPKQTDILYPPDKMKTVDNCMSWCNNNPLCHSVNTTYDSSGKLLCTFYSNNLQNSVKAVSPGSNIYSKNEDPYVYEPDTKLLKNNSFPIGNNKEYSLKYYKSKCGPYGCCADGITPADKGGTNCTTPSNRVGSASPMFPYTALGGINKRVSIDDQSGSSFINYTEVPEQFMNYTSNDANNYIAQFIILLFVIVVAVLIYSKYKK